MRWKPIVFLLCFLSAPLFAKGDEVVKIGFMNMPPFYVYEEGKPLGGVFHDLVKEVFTKAEIPFEINGYPAKRLYTHIGQGKVHFFFGIKGPKEFKGNVIYSKTAIGSVFLRAYRIGDKPDINGFKELAGKHVILLRGFSYGGIRELIEQKKKAMGIKIEESNDHKDGFAMLEKGRADYFLDFKLPSEIVLSEIDPIPGLTYNDMLHIDGYFILSNKLKGHEQIMKKLETSLLELKKKGQLPPLAIPFMERTSYAPKK